ncbi:MAG: helix-turn-helix transcriptional regulator [Rhizobacter sp.]|nr:helix-turn-helix transcriptional regulator [Rhizobacter sp.]
MDYPLQSPGQLSSHLRALRKARGLSQAQLGAVLGVGQTRVTRIEHDPTAISVQQFLGILNALEVQMVLRTPGTKADAGVAQGAGTHHPSDEPW